jgi:transposase
MEARSHGLEARIAQLERQVAKLTHALEEALRAGKRQAAPFSRGKAKSEPRRPGRRPAPLYGPRAARDVPKKVDRVVQVPIPLFCPECDSSLRLEGSYELYQVDLPVIRTRTTLFKIDYGRCEDCGRRVEGRHREQVTSGQINKVVIGPNAIAMAAHLNKVGGLSYGKVADTFEKLAGMRVNRSTLARALDRLAKKATPAQEEVRSHLQRSEIAYPDETGWRIAAENAWLWAATDQKVTLYEIFKGRGFEQAAKLLGPDYSGRIVSDGWRPYRSFEKATRQACLAHLLRRCDEILKVASRGAVRFPRLVKGVLKDAITLRDCLRDGSFDITDVKDERSILEAALDEALAGHHTYAENRRFAKHLRALRADLFTFLDDPRIEATNWPAEQAIRPAVINRKTCGGGNRTARGARTQAVLMTVLRTCRQIGRDSHAYLAQLLRSPVPVPLLAGVTR